MERERQIVSEMERERGRREGKRERATSVRFLNVFLPTLSQLKGLFSGSGVNSVMVRGVLLSGVM